MTTDTTHITLHNILRCISSGDVTRTQAPIGGWVLTINGEPVTEEEIQLGVSVLDARGLIHWWPDYQPTQHAVLSLKKGASGRDTVKEWDHRALMGRELRLEPALLHDAYHGDGDEAA